MPSGTEVCPPEVHFNGNLVKGRSVMIVIGAEPRTRIGESRARRLAVGARERVQPSLRLQPVRRVQDEWDEWFPDLPAVPPAMSSRVSALAKSGARSSAYPLVMWLRLKLTIV
jgi:hypothetical protein